MNLVKSLLSSLNFLLYLPSLSPFGLLSILDIPQPARNLFPGKEAGSLPGLKDRPRPEDSFTAKTTGAFQTSLFIQLHLCLSKIL